MEGLCAVNIEPEGPHRIQVVKSLSLCKKVETKYLAERLKSEVW